MFYINIVDTYLDDISKFPSDGSKNAIVDPQIGMACVAQHTGNWCRGKINEIRAMEVDVEFVDFGIVVLRIEKKLVKEMEEEFVQLPPQAHRCILYGVLSTCTSQASTKFKQATSDKELVALFIDQSSNGKYSVIMSECTGGSDFVINRLFIPTHRPTESNPCVASNVTKRNPPQITQVKYFLC